LTLVLVVASVTKTLLDEIARMGVHFVEEEGSDVFARHAVIVNEA